MASTTTTCIQGSHLQFLFSFFRLLNSQVLFAFNWLTMSIPICFLYLFCNEAFVSYVHVTYAPCIIFCVTMACTARLRARRR
jgi:hypothetical protein